MRNTLIGMTRTFRLTASRAAIAALIATAGAVICLANDHYWQTKLPTLHVIGSGYPPIEPPAFESAWFDVLLVASPSTFLPRSFSRRGYACCQWRSRSSL